MSWMEQQQSWVGEDCIEENCLHAMFGVAASQVALMGHTAVAIGQYRQAQSSA